MKILFFGQKNSYYSNKAIKLLKQFTPQLTIVLSSVRNSEFPKKYLNWKGDYIFSFENYYIIPESLIENSSIAINIHPSSPEYRGSGGANWAIYDNKEVFGVTAHTINKDIDLGKILFVKRFPIHKEDNGVTLTQKSKKMAYLLFEELIKKIFQDKIKINTLLNIVNDESWEGEARKIKLIDRISEINHEISAEELNRRIKAFHSDSFPLKMIIHGKEFHYNEN